MQSLKKIVTNALMVLGFSFALITSASASETLESFNKSKDLAEQGEVLHQTITGSNYAYGLGVRQDYTKAFYWYQQAANQGYGAGQYFLGGAYYTGKGVSQDYKSALYWLKKAAAQNEGSAQFSLGIMYGSGHGVQQSKKQAKEWYGKSCDNGVQYGCDNYKELNEQGY